MINVNLTTQIAAGVSGDYTINRVSTNDYLSSIFSGSKIIGLDVPLTGSTFTSLATGSITDYKLLYLKNTETSSYSASIFINTTSGSFLEIGPNEVNIISPTTSSLFGKASGGTGTMTIKLIGIESVL